MAAWSTPACLQGPMGQRGSARERDSEGTHACEHKDSEVQWSFHSPPVIFSWWCRGKSWHRGCPFCFTCFILLQSRISCLSLSSANANPELLPRSELAIAILTASLCPQILLGNITLLNVLHLNFYCLHILNLNIHNISIRSDSTNDENLFKCYHYLLLD